MTHKIRIVFFGSPQYAVPTLLALHQYQDSDLSIDVSLVVTQPDKPLGRGKILTAPLIKIAAQQLNLPVYQPNSLKSEEAFDTLRNIQADLFVVIAYGKILPQNILDIPRLGCVNLHASILPQYRGAAPIAQAILAGELKTGVCLMKMDAGLDTGGVYAKAETNIKETDTTLSLSNTLADLSAKVLLENIKDLFYHKLIAKEQNHPQATYARKLSKQDGLIDFSLNAQIILRKIRAYFPWPTAFFFYNNKRFQILSAQLSDKKFDESLPLGKNEIEEMRWHIICGDHTAIELLVIKPEGKKAMSAHEFLLGLKS